MVEGEAEIIRDTAVLERIAVAYEGKYGADWRFDVTDEALEHGEGGRAVVFRVDPITVFGFAQGSYSPDSMDVRSVEWDGWVLVKQ